MVLTGKVFVRRSGLDEEIGELLKEATAAKATNPDAAVARLRTAYAKIARTKTVYPVETFLRLPMYLQAAGRGAEALEELDRLFVAGYPNWSDSDALRLMDQATVSDKRRLVLQREKRFAEAVPAGVLSWVLEIRSEMAEPPGPSRDPERELRRRQDQVDRLRAPDFWTPKLRRLLKQAKARNAEVSAISLVGSWIGELPQTDDDQNVKRLTSLLRAGAG